MTGHETDQPAAEPRDAAPADDVLAALVEAYNGDAVALPPDPWLAPVAEEQPVSAALDDLYNH